MAVHERNVENPRKDHAKKPRTGVNKIYYMLFSQNLNCLYCQTVFTKLHIVSLLSAVFHLVHFWFTASTQSVLPTSHQGKNCHKKLSPF